MSTTITIRADEGLKAALQKRADAESKSVSELAREFLANSLAERAIGERAGHLCGILELPATEGSAWAEEMEQRNRRS